MSINATEYKKLRREIAEDITLVAVSKTKSIEDIKALYDLGQRDFGENYVQELNEKYDALPKDINWHFIGHLQSNKVKFIAPFISLIQSVDSYKLLKEINAQARKNKRLIKILLQIHIAQEETKFGLSKDELDEILKSDDLKKLQHIHITGLMGMASFTNDKNKIANEFSELSSLYNKYKLSNSFKVLSMGMSADYALAIENGTNLIRIGSLLFGERHHL